MDRIHIRDLLVRTIIGVSEEERRDRQDVIIGVTLWTDMRKAGKSDRIEDTVNYRSVNKRILEMAESSSYYLVEALAQRIAEICLEEPGVQKVNVRVNKPGALRFAGNVGVEIEREHE
jgi:FolB domain-containing protein